MTGAWARAECGGWGSWPGMWIGQAFGVFFLPGLGVSSSSPQVPRHPASMCDSGINVITEQ